MFLTIKLNSVTVTFYIIVAVITAVIIIYDRRTNN